jgi:hypothetical protein
MQCIRPVIANECYTIGACASCRTDKPFALSAGPVFEPTNQDRQSSKAGCTRIFTDTASGAKAGRKGLEAALPLAGQGIP